MSYRLSKVFLSMAFAAGMLTRWWGRSVAVTAVLLNVVFVMPSLQLTAIPWTGGAALGLGARARSVETVGTAFLPHRRPPRFEAFKRRLLGDLGHAPDCRRRPPDDSLSSTGEMTGPVTVLCS